MSQFDTDLIPAYTAEQMETVWREAVAKILDGYALLHEAEKALHGVFGKFDQYSNLSPLPDSYRSYRIEKGDSLEEKIVNQLRRSIWRTILNILEVQKHMSTQDKKKLDERLEKEDLPEITIQAIADIFASFMQNHEQMFAAMCQEAFQGLYPRWQHYQTNELHRLGQNHKVILQGRVERRYNGGFRPSAYREQEMIVVDRVFHGLDGKAMPASYRSPLVDAINTTQSDGKGETEYFRFQCYHNRNLHMTFKRPDLLVRLLQVVGSNELHA